MTELEQQLFNQVKWLVKCVNEHKRPHPEYHQEVLDKSQDLWPYFWKQFGELMSIYYQIKIEREKNNFSMFEKNEH